MLATPLVLALAGCGASPAAHAMKVTRFVEVRSVYFAQFRATALADAAGYALYVFAPDDRRAVTCTGSCALTWPPLTVTAGRRPALGPGVRAGLVGADTAPDRSHVVTYDGWPLYTYTGDVDPGEATGAGIDLNGGAWYLIRPDGAPLRSAVAQSGTTGDATA